MKIDYVDTEGNKVVVEVRRLYVQSTAGEFQLIEREHELEMNRSNDDDLTLAIRPQASNSFKLRAVEL